jgi:hypothetical protein
LHELQCFQDLLVPNLKKLRFRIHENQVDLKFKKKERQVNVESSSKERSSLQDHKIQARIKERGTSYVNQKNYKIFLYYHCIKKIVIPRIPRTSNSFKSHEFQ